MDLHNTVALMTGGRRIGRIVAEELAKRGANLALCYGRSRQEADATATAVRAHGVTCEVFQADLSKPEECAGVVTRAAGAMGRIDILLNMASVYVKKPLADLTVVDWDASLNVDLRAAFLCSHAALPYMRAQGGGRIINFSDWVARSGRPRYLGYVPYYVAKSGVIALTEALALELAADNILVNAVAPGPILAPADTSTEEIKAVEDVTPLKRWGGEIEIAKAVLALLDADFMTGETVRVDGGRHLR
ncbi:MAG TPA: SDR family oxidoreductase [Vicinamibacterales bacterium]|nr:SDR family oxidoreductase [Vicinamibacterales bacterium]